MSNPEKPQLTVVQANLLTVAYATAEQLLPEHLGEVVAAMEQAGRLGRQVVVHEVGPEVRSVPISVPTYWLEIVSRSELQLAGMAIISPSLAVRIAANAFGQANQLRRNALQVRAFTSRAEALEWAAGLLPTG